MKFLRLTFAALLLVLAVSPVQAELVNGIKAVVHTSVITYGEVEADVLMLADEYRRQYGQTEAFRRKIETALKESFDRAIQHQLILRDFTASGYNLPESVIDEVVADEIKATYGDRATLTKTLQARGITFEKWRQQSKERFLVRQLRMKNIHSETIISPYKIENYYNAHRDEYKVAEQVKLRMIMLNKGSDEESAGAQALAREILTKIKAGAAFSEMASVYSQGAQRSQGGDWGWAERSVLRSELADVAFKLNPGDVSDIIDTPQAYFILLVENKRADHIKPISEVRDEIENALQQQERARLEAQYVEKLKKKTFIRKFDY